MNMPPLLEHNKGGIFYVCYIYKFKLSIQLTIPLMRPIIIYYMNIALKKTARLRRI